MHDCCRWCKGVIIPPIDLYQGRPSRGACTQECPTGPVGGICPDMETVSFNEYCEYYTTEHRKTFHCVGVDSFSNLVYRRPTPIICRYTDCNPSTDIEGFCFNLLLEKVPFRSETELLHPRNTEGSYFAECIRRGFIKDQESLETLISEYCMKRLYSDFHVANIMNEIVARNPDFGDPNADPYEG